MPFSEHTRTLLEIAAECDAEPTLTAAQIAARLRARAGCQGCAPVYPFHSLGCPDRTQPATAGDVEREVIEAACAYADASGSRALDEMVRLMNAVVSAPASSSPPSTRCPPFSRSRGRRWLSASG